MKGRVFFVAAVAAAGAAAAVLVTGTGDEPSRTVVEGDASGTPPSTAETVSEQMRRDPRFLEQVADLELMQGPPLARLEAAHVETFAEALEREGHRPDVPPNLTRAGWSEEDWRALRGAVLRARRTDGLLRSLATAEAELKRARAAPPVPPGDEAAAARRAARIDEAERRVQVLRRAPGLDPASRAEHAIVAPFLPRIERVLGRR